ncbi:hypothetical protein V8E54_003457 [Elaphomyces granulatus]
MPIGMYRQLPWQTFSDNTPIRIESIRKRLYEEFAGDDDEPPKVTPRRGTGPIFTQFSYRLFPEWRTSYLWYKDWTFNMLEVEEDVIKDRYPHLAKFYFEWCGNMKPRLNVQNITSELMQMLLQDNVAEVKYDPLIGPTGYHLLKGQLEEELVRFLTDMEALLPEKSPKDQG